MSTIISTAVWCTITSTSWLFSIRGGCRASSTKLSYDFDKNENYLTANSVDKLAQDKAFGEFCILWKGWGM